jgi:hypothetical protein
MIRRLLGLFALGALGGPVVFAAAGCGGDSSTPVTYTVLYRLETTGSVTWDWVEYDDGSGTMQRVLSPAADWATNLTATSGASVEARASGTAHGAATIVLVAEWVRSGVTSGSATDTLTAAAGVETPLVPHVPKRTL